MASLLEKVTLGPNPLCLTLESPGDIMLAFSIFLAYFLQGELKLPPLTKPQTIVLTMKFRYFLEKAMKVEVMMEGEVHVSFTGVPCVAPLYL